jgi:hypothetical protein
VRYADFVTAFPGGINAAATWNKKLIRERAMAIGQEFRGKGINIALGPAMNLVRIPQGGRSFEGFGADPYLAGEAAYETILGMQQAGLQACAKHLIDNEQEHKRQTSSSLVDDRTQHELYLHPFLRSVMAGVVSIMCSYSKSFCSNVRRHKAYVSFLTADLINGTYACENDKIMNDLVKRELGFQGCMPITDLPFIQFVAHKSTDIMSDWGGTMSTMGAATGLDVSIKYRVHESFSNRGSRWICLAQSTSSRTTHTLEPILLLMFRMALFPKSVLTTWVRAKMFAS